MKHFFGGLIVSFLRLPIIDKLLLNLGETVTLLGYLMPSLTENQESPKIVSNLKAGSLKIVSLINIVSDL